MKLTIFVAACMAIVAVQSASVPVDQNNAVDKFYLEKQAFIFGMVYKVAQPLIIEEYIKLGGSLVTDKNEYTEYNKWMVRFYDSYKLGELLPQGEFFSAVQRGHIIQSTGLFNFFYYAKNWSTLVKNIAWARMNVNEGMFVQALTLAVIHREDMQGIIMPQIYEIFPEMFFSTKYIMAAKQFDWERFNRQIMLEKELKNIYENENSQIFGNQFYMKDWKTWQWWKLMGLDEAWKLEDKSIAVQANDPLWNSINSKLNKVWMPADYTRDISIMNDDSKISYFTEDVRWNAYWYYLNMDYSWSLNARATHLNKDRRGEWWIFNVQQLLARYYMERLSQGLGEFDMMSWHGVFKTGYDSQLIAYNGNGFTFRKNYWEIESTQNYEHLDKIVSFEHRIDDAIASGKYVMKDGTAVDLRNPQSIDFVGKVMQGSVDTMDKHFIGLWFMFSGKFLSDQDYLDMTVEPNVMMNYETMMRDPLFYGLLKRVANKFHQFKNQLPAYTKEELLLPGVDITAAQVSKLMTYFKFEDFDVTTLLNDKMAFNDGMLNWDKSLLLRQQRLYCDPFQMSISITAKKEQDVVISVFLAPEFNSNGEKMGMSDNRDNFLQIDKFVAPLSAGKNVINRSSEDFDWTASDPHTYSEMYNYLSMTYDGKYQFEKNISQPHSLFPANLVLPHGWVKGMPMSMFFVASSYMGHSSQQATFDSSYLSGIGSGARFIDSLPFGYPLDRKIDNYIDFVVPNMHYENVKIYHTEKFDKYYPLKYEHFGSFDEDY